MKSLTLRAIALLALGLLAHHIKPFTAANLLSFTSASAPALTALLPEAAQQQWEKAATLAAVMGQAWRADDEPAAFAGQPVMLAANLKPELAMVPSSECALNKRGQVITRRRAQAMPPAATAKLEETADESAISLQDEPADEAQDETPAVETFALPFPAATGKSLSLEAPKRDACEMPASQDAEPAAPMPMSTPRDESQWSPAVKPLHPKHPASPLEIEIQPIFSPAQTLWMIRLKQARQNAAKC